MLWHIIGKRGGRGPVLGNNTGKDCSDRYKENQSKADPDTSTTHVVVSSLKRSGQTKQNIVLHHWIKGGKPVPVK